MGTHIFEDAREYILPIFTVEAIGNEIVISSRKYCGTAFLVTNKGDAITAAHILPAPEKLNQNIRLIAVAWLDGKEVVCWVNRSAIFDGCDLALLNINAKDTKFLNISDSEIFAGTDVFVIGVPNHEVRVAGKEMRVFKGYVTLSYDQLELNFPIPPGMSGAPVFVGSNVIGFATGVIRSEDLIDQFENDTKLTNTIEQIHINTTSRIVYYGLAYPFFKQKFTKYSFLENKTLLEFIIDRNG